MSSHMPSSSRESKHSKVEKRKIKKANESIVMFVLSKQVIPIDGGGDLTRLLYKIQACIISVSAMLRHHSLVNQRIQPLLGKTEQSLVKTAEVIFLNALSTSGATCIVASLYCEHEYYLQEKLRGEYVVTFVPLEGDIHNTTAPVGSIFSIFRKSRPGKLMDLELMQPGKNIVACGYALYGPVTTLVLALAHGVGTHMFTLDPESNDFIRSPKRVTVPNRGMYYSINEGVSYSFEKNIAKYLRLKKDVKKIHLQNECVYSGSIVSDFHAIITHGGIVMKPSYRDLPFGKALLQFQVNPLAFIMIQAGGLASDGNREITSLEIPKPRIKSPLYCGSVEDVSELVRFTSKMRSFKM